MGETITLYSEETDEVLTVEFEFRTVQHLLNGLIRLFSPYPDFGSEKGRSAEATSHQVALPPRKLRAMMTESDQKTLAGFGIGIASGAGLSRLSRAVVEGDKQYPRDHLFRYHRTLAEAKKLAGAKTYFERVKRAKLRAEYVPKHRGGTQ